MRRRKTGREGQTRQWGRRRRRRTAEEGFLLWRIGQWTRGRETEGEAVVGCDACD